MLTKVDGGLDMLRRGDICHVGRVALSTAMKLRIRETSEIRKLIHHQGKRVRNMELKRCPRLCDDGALVPIVVWLPLVADTTRKLWVEELAVDIIVESSPLTV